ncbi:N-acetylmuramoyl-L-alanine amidase [Acaryochloris marina]|uniref:N-acetylmuramoyl-L-alanine amidase n=1 Tax=Acaryochloris marina TaxID=155978 RepID=UPI001BAF86DC|nr:N-acetylmuramoyl-L-alanine amidase [Acaryochloris marina S15]
MPAQRRLWNCKMRKASWVLPLALSLFCWADSASAGQLTYWKFNSKKSRIDLITNSATKPRAKVVMNPTRLVIDLPNTTFRKLKARRKISKYVREVRVAQHNRKTTRVVVELSKKYTLSPRRVLVRGIAPNRWYIQLPKFFPLKDAKKSSRKTIAIRVPPPKIPKPSISSPGPIVSKPVKSGAKVVVIDPGHGGADPGAVGIGGIQEKRVVLDVSTQVHNLLRKRGINAVLTRSGDREVDLPPRVAKAEGARADVFVSIHANAISLSRPDINGLETYYYVTGYRLARAIHTSIRRAVSVGDRGIRQARFYVLRKSSMPAVLVELGFLTGRTDAAKLRTAAHRKRLAEAIAQGIVNYLQGK